MKSFFLFLGFCVTLFVVNYDTEGISLANASVASALEDLGVYDEEKKPDFTIKGVSVEAGENLVKNGFGVKKNGKKTKKQSKHFVCTSCHNVVKEDIDLANPDPQSRLEYSYDIGIPFLQGTTLYGAVNRATYYNGDYDKKYGDLVKPARNNIREAIQLCAVECAQGRKLDKWEIESILAYLWTIDLKMTDLIFSPQEIAILENSSSGKEIKEEKIEIIQSKYLDLADAHFVIPPFDRKAGYEGITPNPFNGKLVYEQSCLHCHENQRYSYLHLDNTKFSFKYLKKKTTRYHPHSLYQVTRWGVPVRAWKKSYMPQYTEEKMTNQQLEDLRAYIFEQAK